MSRFIVGISSLILLFCSGLLSAAPSRVDVVYKATRNGQPFATITESYRQENGRYRIESVTKGIGVYALFGERKLISEGAVTEQGLKPSHFEQHQGDNEKKSLFADFDWPTNTLTMKVKGKQTTAVLEAGTQDLSSFIYQFMFARPVGDELNLPVTTGKKLRNYRYTVVERDLSVAVANNTYTTIHLVQAAKEAGDDQKELWLGAESHHLPVKLAMVDENGAKIEQVLTSLHAE